MSEWISKLFGKENITKENYRLYTVNHYAALFSLFGHALNIFLFLLIGVKIIAYFNILSALMWIACVILNRKGFHILGLLIASVEVIAHAILCTYVIGWASGYHYFIMVLIPFLYFIPQKRHWISILLTVLIAAVYMVLYYFLSHAVPYQAVDPTILNAFNYYNIVLLFAFLAVMSFYYSKAAGDAEQKLDNELKRSESLLLNILPAPIADRLKHTENNRTIADEFTNVTVLFADLVGFTRMCSETSADKTVTMLNEIFSIFDILVEKHGLEKIKTIGDAYMLAGGLPLEREDHAEAVAEIALDIIDTIRNLGYDLNIRIGIHSGPVVAGVIGTKKFIYDLWGDTVNTASRMESHGIPGRIQCSESTYRLLKDRFRFEERGEIEVKGKGKMKTYLLSGRCEA